MEIDLFSLQTIEALTIYSFLGIIFLIIIRYVIFAKDIENRQVAKVIGGFAVFIVAILSQNPFVILVSLFIGGLLIATEDFMKQLAIIFRSESKDIGENLKPVSATPKEIKEKQQQQVHETIEVLDSISESPSNVKKKKSPIKIESVIHGEKAMVNYLQKKYDKFTEDIKFENESGKSIVVDGIILNEKNDVVTLIEVRVLKTFEASNSILARTVDKVRSVIQETPLIICFVFIGDITNEQTSSLEDFSRNFYNVNISIFQLTNNQLKPKLEVLPII